jgi:hypothetical protein
MSAYTKPKPGEWVQPVEHGYKMACCDCGLVHKIDFRVENGRVQFRVVRDNRATGQIRRHQNITVRTVEE